MQAVIDNHRAIGREGYLYGRRSVCQQRITFAILRVRLQKRWKDT